jgi:glycosyltransferase involved in cell wall biosynthesis
MAAPEKLRVAYITAGAAGMFCGSCLHDNTLVAALRDLGHDAMLIPLYTPIRTDEPDVSQHRVFFGGINVYLQQKFSLFRHTPWFLDRLFDAPRLLNWVSRFAVRTEAQALGELTISILKGEHGYQKKEIEKLATWLADEVKPDIVQLTNVLLSGIVPRLRQKLGVPVIASLQGDDVFLDAMPATYRERCLELIRDHCSAFDGFIATSRYYADFMSKYLDIPRDKIQVVYPGLNLKGFGDRDGTRAPDGSGTRVPTIGYFARVCPEKGLHVLVDAFCALRKMPDAPRCRLRASGWLGENQRGFLDQQRQKMQEAGLHDDFDYVESPDHESKVRFLQSLDLFCVPTVYHEPKGLYLLEAWATGLPVVQPAHGSFPELIEATGGGLLVPPDNPTELARGLRRLLERPDERSRLGSSGKQAVEKAFHARAMAETTEKLYRAYLT